MDIMDFQAISRYRVPLQRRPIIENTHPMFVPQCDKPGFTAKQNTTGKIIFLWVLTFTSLGGEDENRFT